MRTIFFALIGFLSIGFGAFLDNIPVNLLQQDGSKISCFSSGDEYYVRLHDEHNYTIIQNSDDGGSESNHWLWVCKYFLISLIFRNRYGPRLQLKQRVEDEK